MDIAPHKIRAGMVVIIALAIGIGMPLFIWLQNQNVGSNLKGQLQLPTDPAAAQGTNRPQLQCSASPSSAQIDETVRWSVQIQNTPTPTELKILWSGAVTGEGQTITNTYSNAGTFTATAALANTEFGNATASCSVQVAASAVPPVQPLPPPIVVPPPTPPPAAQSEPIVTRAEAVVLVGKAAKIAPHEGCYKDTPHCGAGSPNFFTDIKDPIQGAYIRTMWDLKYIDGILPGSFDPDSPMSRSDAFKLIAKVFKTSNSLDPSDFNSIRPITLSELVQVLLKNVQATAQ